MDIPKIKLNKEEIRGILTINPEGEYKDHAINKFQIPNLTINNKDFAQIRDTLVKISTNPDAAQNTLCFTVPQKDDIRKKLQSAQIIVAIQNKSTNEYLGFSVVDFVVANQIKSKSVSTFIQCSHKKYNGEIRDYMSMELIRRINELLLGKKLPTSFHMVGTIKLPGGKKQIKRQNKRQIKKRQKIDKHNPLTISTQHT